MNNKKMGTQFEREFCQYLAENGWWAHFLTPSASGAQPFDIIALRNRDVYDSLTKAAKAIGVSDGKVSEAANGKRKLKKGFEVRYVN